ncbi:arsenical pump-driving ATPase [Salmonella enterica subsp. enterica]|uniref:Arsenical pump-driving ATPase n=1 Tax=Salmonella enterica I TaxID=59201 RepID=A0A379WR95_SALET|nr:arsenical pump-driving ATPase [Salmonella enterica subsp. enterica]
MTNWPAIGLTQQYLVINGLLPEQETARDKLAQALYQREQQALQHLLITCAHCPAIACR